MKKLMFAMAMIAMTAGVGAADAQAPRPFKIGVAGGISMPVGDLSDGANTGFVLNANIGVKPVAFPFTLQAEFGWNQWAIKDTPGNSDGNIRILNVSGNIIHDFRTMTPVKPYVLGTAGLYHVTGSVSSGSTTVSTSSNKFGLGGGVGIRFQLSNLDTYLEARYAHALDTSLSFVPITFGIRF